MILLHHFLFLDKAYNNQNQEGLTICQKQPLKCSVRKGVSEISHKSTFFRNSTVTIRYIIERRYDTETIYY